MLGKQYVAWHCNHYTAAPISDWIINHVFQELLLENDYFGNKSHEKIYIDLCDSMGYTDKIEKPSGNDTKLTVTIETKSLLAKKMGMRRVPRLTLPRGQFPDWHLPDGHFPEGHFPDWTFLH